MHKGYITHVLRMAVAVTKLRGTANDPVSLVASWGDPDAAARTVAQWTEYAEGPLAKLHALHCHVVGGKRPAQPRMVESEDEDDQSGGFTSGDAPSNVDLDFERFLSQHVALELDGEHVIEEMETAALVHEFGHTTAPFNEGVEFDTDGWVVPGEDGAWRIQDGPTGSSSTDDHMVRVLSVRGRCMGGYE